MTNMISVKDVADALGVSLKKAYKVVKQPDFPKIKIGNQYKIPEKEFDQWVSNYLRKEYQLI